MPELAELYQTHINQSTNTYLENRLRWWKGADLRTHLSTHCVLPHMCAHMHDVRAQSQQMFTYEIPESPKTALDFLERCLPWKRLWAKWQGSQRCFKSRVIVSSPPRSIYIVRPGIISARLRLHASPLLHWPRNVSCIPSICGTMHVLQIKRII